LHEAGADPYTDLDAGADVLTDSYADSGAAA